MKRYIVVGGNPLTMWSGYTTFTDITVLGHVNTEGEAAIIVDENYDQCAGLIRVIDLEEGADK